ncbi:bacteriophage N4 adsorption protein B [compost metagenome]
MAQMPDQFIQEIQAGFFGDFLISKRLITDEQLRLSLKLQEKEKRHLRIGEILVEQGYLDPAELIPCLTEYKVQIRLGELLISNGELSFMQLLDALDEQRRTGDHLGEILIRNDFCEPESVREALELQQSLLVEA